MRRKALAALLIVAVFVLAACATGQPAGGEAAAEPGGEEAAAEFTCPEPNPRMEVTSEELNLFVWTEYIPEEMIDCFEQVYGVTVNRNEYSSNEEMYAKLSAGNTSYDLTQPTDTFVGLMLRQGMLEKLDKSKLPVLANFAPQYLGLPYDPGNDYTLPYLAGTDAIAVNTDAVEEIPAAYADLWNPAYADRLVMVDDARTIIGATLLTLGFDPNTTNPDELEQAKEKLAELTPNVRVFDSDSPKTALIAGDADLGIVWTGEARLAADEAPGIQYVYPSEGVIRWLDNWAIPTGAPHPDAAYAWLNYINQPELFWTTLRDFPYNNPNQAALAYAEQNQPELYASFMGSNITNPPAEALANVHWLEDVGEATPLYDRIWTEVKGQ
jgi:spermidine/putrescine-binding protein